MSLKPAAALSGSQFNAGNIIDPSVFLNPGSMNAGDVQNFLNAKVPTCNTNHTKSSSSNDSGPPYTCLKDYSQDTPSKSPDVYCNNGINGAHKTAAQIIFDVSQACGISPKVLIVLLQKEQGLVTDDWPWTIQYTKATGYGCPDSALPTSVDQNQNGCYDDFEGFFNQVYYAARQFERYIREPQNFNFAAGHTSNIQYNPNAACGSSGVNLQNGSTAALYNYTPYQPNAAALNNLYGSGDSCSSYGNRNFWRMFNDWFGSTQTNTPYAWSLNSVQIYANAARTQGFSDDTTVAPGGHVYIRVTATNIGNQTWNKSQLNFGTYRPPQRSSQFSDPSWFTPNYRPATLVEDSVPPGSVGTFEFVLTAPGTTGQYQEYFNLVAENVTWLNDLGLSIIVNVVSAKAEPVNTNKNILHSGEKLFPSDFLLSSEGQSVFTPQRDGNLVLYGDFKAKWNTTTFGKSPDHLEMGLDGNLVMFFKDGTTWQTNTPTHPGGYLKIQHDGNLVLYDVSNNAYWNTVTFHNPDNLAYVNTELHTANMFPGQQLETADRRYRLVFQADGNLVLYSTNRALWSANTQNSGANHVSLQDDGNMVIYDINSRAIWNTRTFGNGPSRLVIQQDGNLVLYNGAGRATWNTVTFGQF